MQVSLQPLPVDFIHFLEERKQQEKIQSERKDLVSRTIPLHSLTEWQQKIWKNSKHGDLLEMLRRGEKVDFVKVLSGKDTPPLLDVPDCLYTYLETILGSSFAEADRKLYGMEVKRVPKSVRKIFSGDSKRVLPFQEDSVSSYFISLFEYIASFSPVEVNLTVWDLYHGHMFFHLSQSRNDPNILQGDIGIVFHGREFPKEYRYSSSSPVYPIGDVAMNGGYDPRIGTTQSITDSDFGYRNYLWLLSSNSLYLFDPYHDSFPQELISQKEFFTVSEYEFSSAIIGNLNYFPGDKRKRLEKEIPLSTKEYNEDPNIYLIMRYLYIMEKVVKYEDLYPSPTHAFTPELRIKNALSDFFSIFHQIERDDLGRLLKEVENPSENSLLSSYIPPHAFEFVGKSIKNRIEEINEKRNKHNQKQLEILIEADFPMKEAKEALTLTASKGQHSAFRAEQLLRCCIPSKRSAECREKFGLSMESESFSFTEAMPFLSILFYEDHTLEALLISKENKGFTKEQVIKIVASKNNFQLQNFHQ